MKVAFSKRDRFATGRELAVALSAAIRVMNA
jgi:hypothetical protein